MRRMVYPVLAYVFLAACVLLGVANPLYLDLPARAQLAFAALAGLAVGGIAPRMLRGWAAWLILAGIAWIAIQFGHGLGRLAYLLPTAVSVGLAAGLIAWRLPRERRFWRPLPLLIAAAAIIVIALLGEPRPVAGMHTPPSFHPYAAPAYVLNLLDGRTIHSKSLENKTVVLAFWATWCKPCREELPRLQKLYATRYRDKPGVVFYLVDVADGVDTKARARAFLKQYGVTIPSAFDAEGRLMDDLRLPGELPTRIVINADGMVSYRGIGYGTYASGFPGLRKAIDGARSASPAR